MTRLTRSRNAGVTEISVQTRASRRHGGLGCPPGVLLKYARARAHLVVVRGLQASGARCLVGGLVAGRQVSTQAS